MATAPPIEIPAAFDQLSIDEKKAFLVALRQRFEASIDTEGDTIEDAIFAEIEHRRSEYAAGNRRGLSRDELMSPLRAKYAHR